MNTLMQKNHTVEKLFHNAQDTFFGRTIDDLIFHDFFRSPDANIHEDENSFTIEMAVPGMTRKDIRIEVVENTMHVQARKEKTNGFWKTKEFSNTYFQRSFTLPEGANINTIHARCRNGLLTITIGKLKSSGPHRLIKVEAGENNVGPNKLSLWWQKVTDRARKFLS
jgi:HSP20 family protein